MRSEILTPVVALVAWSLVMMLWMFFKRLPALKRAGIDMSRARGGRPGILDGLWRSGRNGRRIITST